MPLEGDQKKLDGMRRRSLHLGPVFIQENMEKVGGEKEKEAM
jgi:hypothetical protein